MERTLPSGQKMPMIGFGTWKIDPSLAAAQVEQAIRQGYRHIDCSTDYANEKEVGLGIKAAIEAGVCKREDIFVTCKLWNTFHRKEHVKEACQKSLSDMGLSYLDLYLIHFPISLKYVPIATRYPPGWSVDPNAKPQKMEVDPVPIAETWQAMEALVAEGLVRNIGVSNFSCALMMDLIPVAKVPIAVNQMELHPYLQNHKLVNFCERAGIAVVSYSSFGGGSYVVLGWAGTDEMAVEDPVIKEIAKEVNRTPAQVILRWLIQRNVGAVPKSSKVERLRENISVFDFTLSDKHMEAIRRLDKGRRYNDPGVYCEQLFNVRVPIFD